MAEGISNDIANPDGVAIDAKGWIEERFENFYGMKFRVERRLFKGKSEFQAVDVVETAGHGRMLLNDGLVMTCERDEFVYHEMIAHVPLFVHPNPKRVLVIGGGDGGSARECLRHPGVEYVKMVEIDKMVIDACKEHLQVTAKDLEHPNLNLEVGDGVKYMAETDEMFDVILIDSTDPIGPAAPLFGPEFYTNVQKRLSDGGIVVSQGESPFFHVETQQSMLKILGEFFPVVSIYNFHNLTYPGGLWSFTFASKGVKPLDGLSDEKVSAANLEFKYYNVETHRAAFALPQFMKENLKGLLK